MAEYIDKAKAISVIRFGKNDCAYFGTTNKDKEVIDFLKTVPTANVIGCSEYEKLCLVNLDLAETNKGLLAEHTELVELRSKIDEAIEEIEQYLLEEECNRNHEKGIMFALEILKKHIGE